ncbi:16S rRNA (guanine(527)-N(7))-methyltransferase RsmG [Porphyromonadaceae bacterium W3.11]|nr:16S rRNA (guanine(527)-N(7))-methyltransferase RsmG [Porphyromonadaceae bacterium W3.11]
MNNEEVTLLKRLFPSLTQSQEEQFKLLPELYKEWNAKINVISRKDIENVFVHHILHSLSIALFTKFAPNTKVFDVGTGGGLPGIPLAILFPDVEFILIDSIAKKITVASEIIKALNLSNAKTYRGRAEEYKGDRGDYVVSRAAMQMDLLVNISQRLIDTKAQNNALPNGVIALKGGDLQEELKRYRRIAIEEDILNYIPDYEFFETKKIVYIPL